MGGAEVVEDPPKASKRGIWGWMFFDWAAQPFHTLIITFVFAPYFASSVAPDSATGQAYWGYAIGIGGFLIAVAAPILGSIADTTGPRKSWIAVFSFIGIAGCASLWLATPGMDSLILPMVAIIIALIGMEFSAVFNNAMMPHLVPRSELGRLSGSAWGLGYLGGLISLVVVLGLLTGQPDSGKTLLGLDPLFGLDPQMREGDRISGPLTAVWYFIFIIPMFLFTPDTPRRVTAGGAIAAGLKSLFATIKRLPGERSYFSFLISSMLYRDALNALYGFGGIYAAGVLGWSIIQIGVFGILANITGAIGAWLGGRIDQKFGPKLVVTGSVMLLTFCCILVISTTKTEILFMSLAGVESSNLPDVILYFMSLVGVESSNLPDIIFYVAGGLIGAAGGAVQASSRTLLVDQVERDRVTEAFGLYALSGKATAFIGPLAIAFTTTFFAQEAFGLSAQDAQRIGVSPVAILFILGLVLLPFVRSRHRASGA